jgi:hypothetical protein
MSRQAKVPEVMVVKAGKIAAVNDRAMPVL